tara:strand:+ start:533 stop:910 length:378 start_codon:yes stop_codon:yes gene_type:complete
MKYDEPLLCNIINLEELHPTRYRKTDPSTSRNKYKKGMDYKILLKLDEYASGLTADMVSITTGIPETSVSSRLSAMAKGISIRDYGILIEVLEFTRESMSTGKQRQVYTVSFQGKKLLGDINDAT